MTRRLVAAVAAAAFVSAPLAPSASALRCAEGFEWFCVVYGTACGANDKYLTCST